MNEIIEKENIIIEEMIYEIRGIQVMLDSDIAKIYQVETKRINEAVKNNHDKFPKRFSWILTIEETKDLRSKISTLEIKGQGKYSKYAPRVFTEQGIHILATILKSKDEIIIIDNYASKELLDLLKKINKKIIIVSKNIDELLKKKYESQYENVKFINNNSFHDRFIILDRNKLYSSGASFKDLGKKCFAINEFQDKEYLTRLLNIINL